MLMCIILFWIVSIDIFCKGKEEYHNFSSNDEVMDTSDLPPLNYFTLQEPAYFFYDPKVYGEGNIVFGEGHNNKKLQPSPVYPSSYLTNVEDIFGQDNYLRYYADGNVY